MLEFGGPDQSALRRKRPGSIHGSMYVIIDRAPTMAQHLHNVTPSWRTWKGISSLHTMPPWSMISPASRGIGFALARRVLQSTNAPVVATARKDLDKTKERLLEGLKIDEARLRVLRLDVTGMMLMFLCSMFQRY